MREDPEFVLRFATWGTAGVLAVVAISVALFWLLKRRSDRETAAHDTAETERRRRPGG